MKSRPPNAYNSSLPNRSQRLARSGPITPKRRSATEYARIYGSKARVAWVKALPCLVCGAVPSDNAHTRINGMGKKAGFEFIVPLCRTHHRAYDEHQAPFLLDSSRDLVKAYAARVEEAWQHHDLSYLHTTDPLCVHCQASFRVPGRALCAACIATESDEPCSPSSS